MEHRLSRLTANNNSKQDADHEVPYGHADHDAGNRDILHPDEWFSVYTYSHHRVTYRLTLCLVSHNASFTRSKPSTKMRAPTTITARQQLVASVQDKETDELTDESNGTCPNEEQDSCRTSKEETRDSCCPTDTIESRNKR